MNGSTGIYFRITYLLISVVMIGHCFKKAWQGTNIRITRIHSFSTKSEYIQWKDLPCFSHITNRQWELLESLSQKLYDWNTKINLISRKDIELLVPNHIMPCLSMSLVRKFTNGESVIDVGTGGGMPGLPMSILFPDAHFTLIDSNSKKMGVVQDIAKHLDLPNVTVRTTRSEDISEKFDFIFGRAVAAIPKFLGFSSHLLDETSSAPTSIGPGPDSQPIGSGLLYLKGGDFSNELEEARINQYTLFPVNTLLPLQSDKNVLYIPASEIIAFRNRRS